MSPFYRISLFSLTVFLILLQRSVLAQGIAADTLRKYPWIRPEMNSLQYYNKDVIRKFYEKWSGPGRVVIAHFGDSHVQSDIYTGALRNDLQMVRGKGGFGMTFPYSTARTYSAIDYFSSHTGTWLSAKSIEFKPKLPLGVSGVTAKTFDPKAAFLIKFKAPLPADYRKLRIFCRQQANSYDFAVRSGKETIVVDVDSAVTRPIEVVFSSALDSTIEVQLMKRKPGQTEFQYYGMSIERENPGGVLVHCLGIGGSRYGSLLEEVLLDDQLPALNPDLVIVDFGTNDFLYDNRIPSYLEDQITRVIRKVRKACPQAVVLLTTTQDMYRRQLNITAAIQFSDLIRKIARAQQCPFYDWYWISGGPASMADWKSAKLAQRDQIHLTWKGYTLKGQMLADAMARTINRFSSKNVPDSVVFNVDSLKLLREKPDTLAKQVLAAKPVTISGASSSNIIRHKIVKGETLKSIARLYGVSVDNLRRTNGLKSSRIIEGNYLNVETFQPDPRKAKVASTSISTGDNNVTFVTHKVMKGETLSELAERYKVSVKNLKKLNGLKNSRIQEGQVLKIKPAAQSGS